MSCVLGLDLSLRRTGLALWRDGDMSTDHCGYGKVDTRSYTERGIRIARMTDQVRSRIDPLRGEVDLVVVEQYLSNIRGTASDIDIIQLHGFITNALLAWRVPWAYVNAGTLKVFATGKGRAEKSDMCAGALACGWMPANHDEADALWLAGMGAMKLGEYVPFAMTDWRVANLDKVAWPKVEATG